jgi:hypothetical protein
VETEPYYKTPLEGTKFLSCDLDRWAATRASLLSANSPS